MKKSINSVLLNMYILLLVSLNAAQQDLSTGTIWKFPEYCCKNWHWKMCKIYIWDKNINNTWYSKQVTYASTNHARQCLTAVNKREPVLPLWYDRWQLTNIVFHKLHVSNPDIASHLGLTAKIRISEWGWIFIALQKYYKLLMFVRFMKFPFQK